MPELGVAYYRVSTKRQGASGLGLEAQQQAVQDLMEREGIELLDSFTEIESGTGKSSRPMLEEAVSLCREREAVLLIAKLDRLARNVHFLSGLMEAGVRFKACDIPQADEFTVHILAAVAQQEAKAISTRTKAALEAARARGVKLGSPKGFAPGVQRLGNRARAKQARDAYDGIILDHVCALRDSGMSYGKIADRLNVRGVRTRRGKIWTSVQVRRLYLRYC